MSQYLNPRQSWELATRNAARQGRPLPIPSDGPQLDRQQAQLWTQQQRQRIAQVQPIQSPAEWLAAQSQRHQPEAQRRQSWQALEAQRATAARPELPPAPAYDNLSRQDYERMKFELEGYRGHHD